MACRWVVEGGIRFHVPDCWGTVHDPDGPCHCPRSKETLEDRIEALEARLARICTILEQPQ